MTRLPALLIPLALVFASPTGTAVEIVPSEETVAERIKSVDAVLLVRALSEPTLRAEDYGPLIRQQNPGLAEQVSGQAVLFPLIEQDVQVVEIMKGRSLSLLGSPIRVGTSGGHNGLHVDADWPQTRAMAVGGSYVLFLLNDSYFDQLRYDRHDMFRVDPPRVTTPHNEAPYAKALLGMSSSAALELIREAVEAP